jgi:hypothetical protein
MKPLDRRTLLRGAGTVAIGLPFLEEMMARPARAQAAGAPDRVVTAFFGLGLDPSWQHDFDGPLEPYRTFRDHMACFSVNVGQGSAGGAHCNTSTVIFVGEAQDSVNIAGGPSIDQLIRNAIDPMATTLVSGLWWRRGACDAQAQRVYSPDGSPRPPLKRPSEVFDRVFGHLGGPAPDPGADPDVEAQRRELRLKRSVLDSVLGGYRRLTGRSSPLGAASKQKLELHLQSIREIETQLAPADDVIDDGGDDGPTEPLACEAPAEPADPDIADYDRFTYGTGNQAPEIAWQDFQRVYRLHADLWAVALRCDLVRYGNLMFESAGGHTNFTGTYSALGDSTTFPGSSQHDSYFHGNQPQNAKLYQHFAQTNLAYFLEQLNDPNYLESNGKTVLENATVVIGTEYGWNHSKRNVFHAVVGGAGRFNAGFFTDREMNCVDLYNAIAQGFGVDARIGQRSGVDSEGDASVLLA